MGSIEYGESESEYVGDSIVAAPRLINHLEINEEVLYERMETIERSMLAA